MMMIVTSMCKPPSQQVLAIVRGSLRDGGVGERGSARLSWLDLQ